MSARRGERARRVVDVVVAAGAIVLCAPVAPPLFVAIRLGSPGPALFRQERVGRDGARFEMLKLRTMVTARDTSGPQVAGKRDPRVTPIGRLLRATKLDELPQLWNVLRGEMTLIGPRAEVPDLLAHYSDSEREILRVKPGLTGAGQLFFTVHQAEELDEVDDPERFHVEHQLRTKLAVDLAYLAGRNWRSDLQLVLYTVLVMSGIRSERFSPRLLRDAAPSARGGALQTDPARPAADVLTLG